MNEPQIVDNTHEWCRKGIKPFKSKLQGLEESSLPWWFMKLRRGEFILIEHAADLPDEAAAERELLFSQSILSLAVVPMQLGGQLIGFVGFDAVHKVTIFSERSLALLEIISSVIANAVDRQIKEKQLVQGQQIQYQLNRITRVSIAKEKLRSAAITLSKELTGLIESEKCILVLLGTEGIPDIYDSGKHRKRARMDYQGFKEFLSTNQELIYINQDLNSELAPEFFRQLGIQSCIVIPLISEEEVLGAAILADSRARQYTREEAAICQQAGPQITLAIIKVKALEAARRRTSELDALRATVADITSELELNKLLRTILERAVRLANADGGEICVFDEENQSLMVVASYNLDKDYTGTWMSIGEGAGGTAVRLKRTFIVEDYAVWPGRMPAYEEAKFHATIVTPLIIGERILGTISLLHFNPDRQFSKDDQHILSLFANHATIAMENAMLFEKVHELARTDTVTGLLNRRALREIGDYEVARARRLDHPIAVAMIDLDDFKAINDTYTHLVGDEVLREVARLFRENIRSIDIISRYGGDEFVLIMPATNRESALRVCRRLQRVLRKNPIKVNDHTFIARFSIGIAVHPQNPPSLDELFLQADEAMYAAKTSGKNRISVYDPAKKGGAADDSDQPVIS
jgi:diguanylate cyclase (GGDEF)-like protein